MLATPHWPGFPGTQGQLPDPTLAARAGSLFVADVNFSVEPFHRVVSTLVAFTAARTGFLPPAKSVPARTVITIADAAGGLTSTNTLTLNAWGSDLINGAATLVLNSAYAGTVLVSDGVSTWSDATQLLAKLSGNQSLTGGFSATAYSGGTQSSGTYTPALANGNFQYITNGGAFTLGVPSTVGSLVLDITNNASAGAITTSSFTKVTGDSFDTTNTHAFRCFITTDASGAGSHLAVQKMF